MDNFWEKKGPWSTISLISRRNSTHFVTQNAHIWNGYQDSRLLFIFVYLRRKITTASIPITRNPVLWHFQLFDNLETVEGPSRFCLRRGKIGSNGLFIEIVSKCPKTLKNLHKTLTYGKEKSKLGQNFELNAYSWREKICHYKLLTEERNTKREILKIRIEILKTRDMWLWGLFVQTLFYLIYFCSSKNSWKKCRSSSIYLYGLSGKFFGEKLHNFPI